MRRQWNDNNYPNQRRQWGQYSNQNQYDDYNENQGTESWDEGTNWGIGPRGPNRNSQDNDDYYYSHQDQGRTSRGTPYERGSYGGSSYGAGRGSYGGGHGSRGTGSYGGSGMSRGSLSQRGGRLNEDYDDEY